MNWIGDIQNLYQDIILEFSEGAIRKIVQKFSNEASEDEIRREVQDFEKYKQGLQKKDPFQYKSWIEFTEAIHAAKGKAEFKKKKIPDESQITSTDDIIADDENVTIYKGDSQDKCVMYGRGYTFCISRPEGGNMFSNYRLGKESTFYFIYFKKKPKNKEDHIMVLDHTNQGYEWTFADNRTQKVKGGWDEIVSKYPELKPYERLLINKKLDDDERNFIKKLNNFSNYPTFETFEKFSYKEKTQALKSIVNLPDDIWKTLDSTLRNEFLSVGPNLTKYQADDLKPNEVGRYTKTRALSSPQLKTVGRLILNKYDYDDINKIASNPEFSYSYARVILHGQNVPAIIINSIAENPKLAYDYATNVLEGQNVPAIIINSIAENPKLTYRYLSFLGDNIPDNIKQSEIITKSIESDPNLIFPYVENILGWENVPPKMLEYILKYRKMEFESAMVNVWRWALTQKWQVSDEIIKMLNLSKMRNKIPQLKVESKSFVDFYYSMDS